MNAPKLELVALSKSYDGQVAAVDALDLAIAAGETLALLGPSGCGKSTTLNMIVGLEQPTAGDIRIDGRSVVDVPAGQRNVGLVFQDYAVFTHMSVRQNLAFGLRVRGRTKPEIERAVNEVAELLDLRDKLALPARLLGGSELQRVAIGRTLVTRPAILLLDEPLSNLEPAARLAMRRELRRLQAEIGLTIVYVTHDQIEALSLADRIAVMSEGRLRQCERTARIFEQPAHVFVASFLGSPPMNLVAGVLLPEAGATRFRCDGFELVLGERCSVAHDGAVLLGVRPEAVRLLPPQEGLGEGVVALVEPRGAEGVVTVEIGALMLKAIVPSTRLPAMGERIGLDVDAADCVVFDARGGARVVH